MIGRDADVRRAPLEQPQHRSDHAGETRNLVPVAGALRGQRVEMPEELVRTVDEMDVHGRQCSRIETGGPRGAPGLRVRARPPVSGEREGCQSTSSG